MQGPTFIGLRRSRSAKSMMVAGVVALVAGYAAPPIAAASGGGSPAGLPGLDCGAGRDSVRMDSRDTQRRCERITRVRR